MAKSQSLNYTQNEKWGENTPKVEKKNSKAINL